MLALLVQMNGTVTELACLVGRMLALQLKGVEVAEREAPDHPPIKSSINGEDQKAEQIIMGMAAGQAMLDEFIGRRFGK